MTRAFLAMVLVSATAFGQAGDRAQSGELRVNVTPGGTADASGSYILGPKDTITIWARDAEELNNRSFTLDAQGFVNMPMVGRVKAGAMTPQQFESDLQDRLKAFIVEPDIIINVTGFKTLSVSVMGAVGQPGVKQFDSSKALIEVLSAAGGLSTTAGPKVRITRKIENGPLPISTQAADATGRYYAAEVLVKNVMDGGQDNIMIVDSDVVTVPKGDVVYVMGDVKTPGSMMPDDNGRISVLQAISRSGGVLGTAKSHEARIFRPIVGKAKQAELRIDVKAILSGDASDVQLMANDILFLPSSTGRKALKKASDLALQIGTQILTFGVYRSILTNGINNGSTP